MKKILYLYGEIHGSEVINYTEFELWNNFYKTGLRHLFMELPYFYTGFINRWMKMKDDQILDELFIGDVVGDSEYDRNFFKQIKELCPETVFHGTDIGHKFDTLGTAYLKSLSPYSNEYKITSENISQAKEYYDFIQESKNGDYSAGSHIREKYMAKNFIRELESVNSCDIVGIYGEAHLFSDSADTFGIEQNMLSMIEKYYANGINIEKTLVRDIITPIKKIKSIIFGKEYDISFFGGLYTPWDENADYITFSKIENAFSHFKNLSKKDNIIPASMYPVTVLKNDVFIIESFKNRKSVMKQLFICDDNSKDCGLLTTELDIKL